MSKINDRAQRGRALSAQIQSGFTLTIYTGLIISITTRTTIEGARVSRVILSAEPHLAVLRCRRATAREPLAYSVEGAVHLVEGLVEALVGLVRVRVRVRGEG